MAITSGSYTVETSGGDYTDISDAVDDIGNLTGDLTITVYDEIQETWTCTFDTLLGGYTLTIAAADDGNRFYDDASWPDISSVTGGTGIVMPEGTNANPIDVTSASTSGELVFRFMRLHSPNKSIGGNRNKPIFAVDNASFAATIRCQQCWLDNPGNAVVREFNADSGAAFVVENCFGYGDDGSGASAAWIFYNISTIAISFSNFAWVHFGTAISHPGNVGTGDFDNCVILGHSSTNFPSSGTVTGDRNVSDVSGDIVADAATAWATSTAYSAGDQVTNDGEAYLCHTGHTSAAADEPGTGANWTDYWTLLTGVTDTNIFEEPSSSGTDLHLLSSLDGLLEGSDAPGTVDAENYTRSDQDIGAFEIQGGATTHQGTATLASQGGLTAAATRIRTGSATLAGQGGIQATASATRPGASSFGGSCSVNAAGTRLRVGSATVGGQGGLSASASVIRPASATLGGQGGLSASAGEYWIGTATLSGQGGLSADGTKIAGTKFGTATLAGQGALSGATTKTSPASSTLAGQGALSASAVRIKYATCTMGGQGALSGTAGRRIPGTATLACTSTLEGVTNPGIESGTLMRGRIGRTAGRGSMSRVSGRGSIGVVTSRGGF